MICRDFSTSYSALLDGRLSSQEQGLVAAHLGSCLDCRRVAGEMRDLGADLESLSRPSAPAWHSSQIISALHREARQQKLSNGRRDELIDKWRVRLLSQTVGAVVSFAMLLTVTGGVLMPAYRALAIARAVVTVVDEGPFDDARIKMYLLEPPPPPPVFNPSGALLGFSESLSEEDILIATVKVRKDGRASVETLTEAPRDPSAIGRLSNALFQQANFQIRRQQGKNPDAVLMFTKINISG